MDYIALEFLRSALMTDSPISPNQKVMQWIEDRRKSIETSVRQIPLEAMRQWSFQKDTNNIKHETGQFFSIEGIRTQTNWGKLFCWDQPIINQPEIGILGFITKKFNGIIHFLAQAKIEPGNINIVQISPTLQATRSNYSQAHKGRRPLYIEFFNGEIAVKSILNQLQSEQGARFFKKRNRNVIVEVPECIEIEPNEDFMWLTLGQLKFLMKEDNVVNMDTRTVISGINYGSYSNEFLNSIMDFSTKENVDEIFIRSNLVNQYSLNSFRDIISWLTILKSNCDLNTELIPVNSIDEWSHLNGEISRRDQKHFSVIGVNVSIENREVVSWDQPMIKPKSDGLIAFIIRPINGVYHFLVQGKMEPGNFDKIELAPTVQCIIENHKLYDGEYSIPFVKDILQAKKSNIIYDSMQSEEGGRFFKEQNRNVIVRVDDQFSIDLPENYFWMTLNQICRFMEFNNYVNISARNLISAISFV